MKKTILLLPCFIGISGLLAQQTLEVFSNGALISVRDSATVWIDGDFTHANNDTVYNYGNIYLTGNWTNNNSTGKVFTSGPNGWLHLTGDTQSVSGNLTHFNNLELAGTGLKKLVSVNAEIEDTLALNNRIFDVDTNTALILKNGTVTNSSGTTVSTNADSGGYVHSLLDGGLARVTSFTNTYFFPVGSYAGQKRYRPLDLTFASAPSDTIFKVGMNNSNFALTVDTTLCNVNSNFYHRIYHGNSSDSANITMYYNNASDGNFQTMAHWKGTPAEWTNTFNSASSPTSVTTTNWSNFSTNQFALANPVPAKPQINQVDTSFCAGGSISLMPAAIEPGATYTWNNGVIAPILNNIDTSGSFVVTVTLNGCAAVSNTVTITVFPNTNDSISASSTNNNICKGDSILLTASGTGTFSWSTGETASSVYVYSAGIYAVTITNAGKCTSTDSVAISLSSFPDTLITTGGATTICKGESVILDAGSGYATYYWFLNGALYDSTQAITADTSGIYSVLVTDSAGCENNSLQDTISVTVNPTPVLTVSKDTTIHYGTSGTLTANGANFYTWFVSSQNVSTSNPYTVSPTEETIYMVVGNSNNCADTAKVTVSVDTKCMPGVPNIFSPNDDLMNDEFNVAGYGFEFQYITIFDRWGNKVMETSDVNTGWNGKLYNSSEPLNNGVYVYILKYKCLHSGEEIQKHGNVTLTR